MLITVVRYRDFNNIFYDYILSLETLKRGFIIMNP